MADDGLDEATFNEMSVHKTPLGVSSLWLWLSFKTVILFHPCLLENCELQLDILVFKCSFLLGITCLYDVELFRMSQKNNKNRSRKIERLRREN